MARPREFDPDDVLKLAMDVFWQHGYEAASLPVLLEGMGITRGSLYKAFADKKSLFLRILDRYETEAVTPAVALLTTGPADGLDRIATLFDGVVQAAREGDHRGCLLCSAAAGPAAVDDDISEQVHLQLGKMQAAFGTALTQARSYEKTSDQDRAEMAAMLLSLYVGLRVLIRSGAPLETIELNASAVARILGAAQNA
jgi:TetR/AcrR family transcriptional repressor of nem operon